MSSSAVVYPFTTFNFSVEIQVPFFDGKALCNAAFSDCDGLDMTMDVKTIREGGNNVQQIRMIGPVNYGQVTLKRGMTDNFDLWDWFDAQQQASADQLRSALRANVVISVQSADHRTEQVRFVLKNCLLTRLKAPVLNARETAIAIEELQLTYQSMALVRPGEAG